VKQEGEDLKEISETVLCNGILFALQLFVKPGNEHSSKK
jgi:hypothetical protein